MEKGSTSTTDRQGGKGKVPIGECLIERGPRYFWLEMVVRGCHSTYDNAGTGPKVTGVVTWVSHIAYHGLSRSASRSDVPQLPGQFYRADAQ